MNVVYIKHFDNGKKYIGITKHFEKRMKEHERAMDNLLVHNAMRKHKHYTEIVFESEDYNDVLEMEKIIIQNFIDLGYNLGDGLYNMTLGGEGTLGCINHADVVGNNNPMFGKTHTEDVKRKLSFIKRKENLSKETLQKYKDSAKRGANNHNSHSLSYYENNPTDRATFKTTCKNQGWVFEEFKELYSGMKIKSGHKKFYYIHMGENYKKEIDYTHELHKPFKYYETHSIQRSNFINICKNNNWDINDFNQILDKTLLTSTGRKYNLYFYTQSKIKKL